METKNQTVDSDGTTQIEAQSMVKNLCERGFSGDVGQMATVLGRTLDEIENVCSGKEEIDDDLAMKIKGIAQERNIELAG
ncbi:MAG TPA: hypothetical protein PKY59_11895 [Pyrinomonadaceae bacterium]|nr:hypothetical protein [Pyrinomonadaceae bacterium]